MVVRCAIYEMLEYLKQLENKEYKRLVPQIMVAFYTGPKKWNVPVKLSDYFEIPEELKKHFNDWKIILVDVKEMDTSKIKDEQTRYFIEAIQAMYKGSYEDLKRLKRMKKRKLSLCSHHYRKYRSSWKRSRRRWNGYVWRNGKNGRRV